MTIHLRSLDEEEHLHGTFSPEANEDLERLDGMVAQLVAAERANDPAATVMIVSDHGFVDVDHAVNLGIALVQAGLMQASSTSAGKTEWQAQPWSLGGMFAIMLRDPKDAGAKAKVKTVLEKVAADPNNGIEAILDAAQVGALGGVPEASFVVTLRKGYVPGPALSGDLVTPLPGRRGTHGYNPRTTPEMRASFFVEGRGVAEHKDLGIVDMRRIAPTVAHLLGIPSPNEGESDLPLN